MDLKERLSLTKEDVSDWWYDGKLLRVIASVLVIYVLISIVLGLYWSREPEMFDVTEGARGIATEQHRGLVAGSVTTSTLTSVASILLDKSGGYLSNDVTLPSIYLDNIPNWEFGVLVQVRDMSRAMRENFSRSQSQSTEDVSLSKAEPRFHFDNQSWIFPRTEDEYRDAIRFANKYLLRLSDPNLSDAQFYARADNLTVWLATVETRLGSLSQRLSASVGQRRLNTDLAGDAQASQSTSAPAEILVKTPWYEIDDVFYEARGTTWALVHLLKAIEADFADVLERKSARVSLQQIIRELEATQQPMWSPVILNGGGFGLFANHSLVMASYISRANAAIIDLRELLSRG